MLKIRTLSELSLLVIEALVSYQAKAAIESSFRGFGYDILGDFEDVEIVYLPTLEHQYSKYQTLSDSKVKIWISFKAIEEYLHSPSTIALLLISKKESLNYDQVFSRLCKSAAERVRTILAPYIEDFTRDAESFDNSSLYFILVSLVLYDLLRKAIHNTKLDLNYMVSYLKETTNLKINLSLLRILRQAWIETREDRIAIGYDERSLVISIINKLIEYIWYGQGD